MLPVLKPGDVIVVNKLSYFLNQPKIGDVIVCKHPQKELFLIKRVTDVKTNRYFITGDNKEKSTDSRNFGWITRRAIVGKMMYKLS